MTENKVSGKKYRILTDAVNDIWDRISFWTKASDVEFNDGSNGEALKTRVGVLEDELTANNKRIYLDYKNGKYGYNTSSSRGSSTFYPFRAPHTTTYAYKDTDGITVDMGEDHTHRYVDGSKLYEKAFMKGWNHDTDGIKFTHHVHSTTSKTKTVEDSNPTTSGNYGAENSETKGGCYTTKKNVQVGTKASTSRSFIKLEVIDDNGSVYMKCPHCGRTETKGDNWENQGHYHDVEDTVAIYDDRYFPSCGHTTGEIVSIRITG